jgi:hypothetical protein
VDALFNPDEIDFGSSTPWAGYGGDGGDGDKRPGLDFTEGDPKQRDEELKKLCVASVGLKQPNPLSESTVIDRQTTV